jgi:hypothetical protein
MPTSPPLPVPCVESSLTTSTPTDPCLRCVGAVLQAFADVQSGRLPDFPTIEVYTHTSVDAGMTDASGHISAALFVQWVPYELSQVSGGGCRV